MQIRGEEDRLTMSLPNFKVSSAARVPVGRYKLVIKPFLINWVFAVKIYSL